MLRYKDLWVNAIFTSSNHNSLVNKSFIYGSFLVHCHVWTSNISWLISCPPFLGCQIPWWTKDAPRRACPFGFRFHRIYGNVTALHARWPHVVFWLARRGHVPRRGIWFYRVLVFGEAFKCLYLSSFSLIFVFFFIFAFSSFLCFLLPPSSSSLAFFSSGTIFSFFFC